MQLAFHNNDLGSNYLFGSVINRLTHKKNRLNKFLQFIFITLLTLCASQVHAKATKVMIYGDSISAGYGMQLHEAWPHLLNETFKSEGANIEFINESISGETTGGGLARLDEVLTRQALTDKDWVIIELGGNDGLRGFPVKTLKQNLTKLIDKVQFQGVNVAIMQVRIPPNYGKRYTNMFESTYPKLAEQYQIPLLPFFMDEVAVNPEYMQSDQLHPNKSAQVIIRDIMKPVVENLVKK